MDSNSIIEILKNPVKVSEPDVFLLENIVKEYPYFNSAQMLLAKKYQLENHADFDRQLKMAAICSADRKVLFKLITSKLEEEKTEAIAPPVLETVEAETQEVVVEISNEKIEIATPAIVEIEKQEEVIVEKEPEIIIEQKTEPVEEKKVEIDTSNKHSFAEWLMLLQGETKMNQPLPSPTPQPIIEIKQPATIPAREKQPEEEKPVNVEELAIQSLKEDENLISATLAEIYANQGKTDKAIKLYEKLILQYPEKKDKFALKIAELKSKS